MQDKLVVVIGSGPPGAAAAVFLKRAGVRVLLLEAGGQRAAPGFTLRVRGLTVAKRRPTLRQREALRRSADPAAQLFEELAPGGLSNHWSLAVPRFAPEDFSDARRAGEEFVWPVDYAELAPWYEQVEPLLCVAGATRDEAQLPSGNIRHGWQLGEAWEPLIAEARRRGRTVLAMPYAYGAESTFSPSGTAFNSFVRLIKPLLGSPGFSVRYGAHVTRLEWSVTERRVVAVFYLDNASGREERVPCSAVVLAAGAINSAEILLQSQSPDFPEGLGNQHGVLGRYLHDHPLGKLVIDLGRAVPVHPASYFTRPVLEQSAPLYAAAGMQWSGAAVLARSLLRGKPGLSTEIGFSVFGTMKPTRDNFLALEPPGRSAGARAGLALNVRHEPEAVRVLDETRDQIVALLDSAGWQPRVRVWKIEPPGNSNHYGGTCRMHDDPRFGMLDRWSRLHQVRNVVVADSSAFTTGPEKNPVLTSMTLSARASDRLARELKSGEL